MAFRIGASGFRSSCESTPRNSSFRRSRVAELALRLLQLLHALLEQPRLAIELQEHVDLAPEDPLVERLVEEVDRRRTRSRGTPSSVSAGPAVTKMIGMSRVRGAPRMISASSKPSISGICTSTIASTTPLDEQQLERLASRARRAGSTQVVAAAAAPRARRGSRRRRRRAGSAATQACRSPRGRRRAQVAPRHALEIGQ